MSLSDAAIRSAKPGVRAYKLSDSGGLYLLVSPNGTRAWRQAYRFGAKQKALGHGIYPHVSLADARARRDLAKGLLARGIDPSVQRKLDQIVAQAGGNTFREIAEEFLEKMKKEGRAEATLEKNRWLLEVAFGQIGHRPIGEVSPPELLSVLRIFEKRGKYESANRLRSLTGSVYRYAIATGRAARDISLDLRGALISPTVKHRAAIVEPSAIGALLRAIDGFDGQPSTKAALQIGPHLFVRPGELRFAAWNEFDFQTAIWEIPARRMKMKRAHRVPLSRQALHTLRCLHKITGNGALLFPSVRTISRPISENTLNAALRRLGYGPDEITMHGFRTTASTRLNEMGRWNPDAIERQLAHQEENTVRRAYMHGAEFWVERVAMMQAWSNYLDELRADNKVIELNQTA